MESRKMVLMNLFAEQQWRCRPQEQTYGPDRVGRGRRKKRVGQMERFAWKHIPYHVSNREPMGICCVTQGSQPGAL